MPNQQMLEDFREFFEDRIIRDIEDIESTLDELSTFIIYVLEARTTCDSVIQFSNLLEAREVCARDPTVICYLATIFNQLDIDSAILTVIPNSLANSVLCPRTMSDLSRIIDIDDNLSLDVYLKRFFGVLSNQCLSGCLL